MGKLKGYAWTHVGTYCRRDMLSFKRKKNSVLLDSKKVNGKQKYYCK